MKEISLSRKQYNTLGLVLTIAVLFNFWFTNNLFFGFISTFLYFSFFGYLVGKKLLNNSGVFWQFFWGQPILLSIYFSLLAIIYWFYGYNISVAGSIIVAVSVLILYLTKIDWLKFSLPKIDKKEMLLTLPTLLLYGLLLVTAYSRRYGDTLISPWTVIGPRFLLVYFLATLLLFYSLKKLKFNFTKLLLTVAHFTTYLTIILLVYKYSFGFDAFIHQSSEKTILELGSISPKQPYYIGQYMLTLLLHGLTHIPLDIVDRLLVPVGASFIIPLSTYFFFVKENKLVSPTSLVWLSFLLLPFFTFTTPNNLALLAGYLVFGWVWYEYKNPNKKIHSVGLILSIGACAIHPFIGLPIFTIFFGSIIYRLGKNNKYILILYGAILTLLLPIILYLNALRLGQGLTLHNPLFRLQPFYKIFTPPHWFVFDSANIFWQILYSYRLAIEPIIFILIIFGFLITLKQKVNQKFIVVTSLSLFISGFLLSTTVEFPGVISYEQGVYSERLFTLLYILLIPFFIIAIENIHQKLNHKLFFIFILSSSLLITTSFYFNYPTRDPISFHTGYQVRDADIEAINFIHDQNGRDANNYIVLSNQTVAAAVIKEFGFLKYHNTGLGPQFFYSIPTGGPMYQYFRKMVYEEPKNQWMQEAMDFAGVDKAYFIHTNYWAPAAKIRDEAKKEANSWWELAEGRVWIYEYLKN